jgi:carbon starvation protein CstA
LTAKALTAMLSIVAVSWLLILGETYVFFAVVRPLGPPLHSSEIISGAMKIGLTAGLAVLWVAVMFGLWWLYFRAHRTPTAAA